MATSLVAGVEEGGERLEDGVVKAGSEAERKSAERRLSGGRLIDCSKEGMVDERGEKG